MTLTDNAMEILGQLFVDGPTRDGNLISKTGRDELVRADLADRREGWNWLNAAGIMKAVECAREARDWHDRRWFEKRVCVEMTPAQRDALEWLMKRGGDGVFDKNGVLIASGESAPVRRETWNALRDLGHVEFYNPAGKGRGRARIVKKG